MGNIMNTISLFQDNTWPELDNNIQCRDVADLGKKLTKSL